VNTEQKVKPLMDEIVKIIRSSCFLQEYQEQATVEECVGIAISKYFEWDTRIFTAFREALEDANFHTAASKIDSLRGEF